MLFGGFAFIRLVPGLHFQGFTPPEVNHLALDFFLDVFLTILWFLVAPVRVTAFLLARRARVVVVFTSRTRRVIVVATSLFLFG